MKKENKFDEKILAYALKNAIEHGGKAAVNSVLNSLFHEGLEKSRIKEVMPLIQKTISEVNSMPADKQKEKMEEFEKDIDHRKEREGLPELPDVPKTGVVMRFRPAPSGPMHVGHVISNMISSLFVKKYGGKFYIIIDDTNPEEALKESYKNIKEDCDWLFGNVHEYINSSDRINIHYKYAEELIAKKFAYVCTCSSEEFKKLIDKSEPCPCRKLDAKENLARWKKMLDKKGYKQGEAVLRFKSDINNPNPAMRDFPLARINEASHPIQGKKYRVWPLMNLSVASDDMDYGMTHVIRGKDHRDNAERQKMIFRALGKEKKFPWTFFMGRIKFTDLILSKRKISAAIEKGEFEGFEDARLPTIASLRKRGYRPEAFAKFAEFRGLTEVDKVMGQKDFFDELDRFNNAE
ncbi:MAG: glutamate--tRNA ligase family protein [Candidatus Paceibacterota bacterium]